MKKLFVLAILAILTSLLIGSMAYARGDDCGKPPKPECGEDMITVEEAQWVDEVPAVTHEEHQHCVATVPAVPAHKEHRHGGFFGCYNWGPWTDGPKHGHGCVEERTIPAIPAVPGHCEGWEIGVCHGAGDCNQRTVVDSQAIPGYWTDPICREPILGCMDPAVDNYNLEAEVDDGSCKYPPQGESCARCSNITPFTWVTWFDRDGGCDGDWYNERVEYPDDIRCGYVPPVICEDEAALNTGEEGECQYAEPVVPVVPVPEKRVCKVTPLYRMVRMIDYDAPEWYWGAEDDNGSCWIIMHEDGTVPSVERQADVCSVCAFPDFVYEGDEIAVDAYVGIDCDGNIKYPDPLWDPDWYRADYDDICREPSCLTK